MKVDRPSMTVTLNEKDLKEAFKSPSTLYDLLRTITIKTYGEEMANIMYPLK